jgi:hypothetical protein
MQINVQLLKKNIKTAMRNTLANTPPFPGRWRNRLLIPPSFRKHAPQPPQQKPQAITSLPVSGVSEKSQKIQQNIFVIL